MFNVFFLKCFFLLIWAKMTGPQKYEVLFLCFFSLDFGGYFPFFNEDAKAPQANFFFNTPTIKDF